MILLKNLPRLIISTVRFFIIMILEAILGVLMVFLPVMTVQSEQLEQID